MSNALGVRLSKRKIITLEERNHSNPSKEIDIEHFNKFI